MQLSHRRDQYRRPGPEHCRRAIPISLTVEDSSIYPPDLAPSTTKSTGAPAFRSFKSSNVIALRDGQSLDYTMATDRLTGEVYRVTVKLTVVR